MSPGPKIVYTWRSSAGICWVNESTPGGHMPQPHGPSDPCAGSSFGFLPLLHFVHVFVRVSQNNGANGMSVHLFIIGIGLYDYSSSSQEVQRSVISKLEKQKSYWWNPVLVQRPENQGHRCCDSWSRAEGWRRRSSVTVGRSRWVSQLVDSEWIPLSLPFCSPKTSMDWMMATCYDEVILISMVYWLKFSSLPETPSETHLELMFYWLPGWHIKLTITHIIIKTWPKLRRPDPHYRLTWKLLQLWDLPFHCTVHIAQWLRFWRSLPLVSELLQGSTVYSAAINTQHSATINVCWLNE